MFASLLDQRRGGRFRIGPAGRATAEDVVTRQLYFPDTAVLITRFMSATGVGELIDFMPVADGQATDRHRLVRIVRVVRGEMTFALHCGPRFDYGRGEHRLTVTDAGAVFEGPGR